MAKKRITRKEVRGIIQTSLFVVGIVLVTSPVTQAFDKSVPNPYLKFGIGAIILLGGAYLFTIK